MKALEKLRESSHLDDDKWTLETGGVAYITGSRPSDPNAVNWGEQWRKIADEIEAEVAEKYMPVPKDADGKRVKFGDKLHEDEDGHEFVVSGFKVWGDSFEWWAYQENGVQAPLERCHIVKPDPLKELLYEFAGDYADSSGPGYDTECVERYAERIRELMEVDR